MAMLLLLPALDADAAAAAIALSNAKFVILWSNYMIIYM
jgi:hypothetical protein